MKYLPCVLLTLAVSACGSHHDLTSCQGPYLALANPPAPAADAPPPPPLHQWPKAAKATPAEHAVAPAAAPVTSIPLAAPAPAQPQQQVLR
jgi:hypothetical protein